MYDLEAAQTLLHRSCCSSGFVLLGVWRGCHWCAVWWRRRPRPWWRRWRWRRQGPRQGRCGWRQRRGRHYLPGQMEAVSGCEGPSATYRVEGMSGMETWMLHGVTLTLTHTRTYAGTSTRLLPPGWVLHGMGPRAMTTPRALHSSPLHQHAPTPLTPHPPTPLLTPPPTPVYFATLLCTHPCNPPPPPPPPPPPQCGAGRGSVHQEPAHPGRARRLGAARALPLVPQRHAHTELRGRPVQLLQVGGGGAGLAALIY